MPEKKKYSKGSREDFLRYLDGSLSDRERHRIERKLLSDPFEEEAMEGYSGLDPGEISRDLEVLGRRIDKRTSGRRNFVFYRAAAVITVLIALSVAFITVFDDRIGLLDRRVADSGETLEEDDLEGTAMTPARETEEEVTVPEKETETAAIPPQTVEQPVTISGEETRVADDLEPDEEVTEISPVEITDEETEMMAPDETAGEEMDVAGDAGIMAFEIGEEGAPAETAMETQSRSAERTLSGKMATMAEPVSEEALRQMVRGTVLSGEDNQPLPGATILWKGTSAGVVSDMGGNFSMPVIQGTDNIIQASYVGMETREIALSGQDEIEIILEPDLVALEEVVVVGYGVEKSMDLTGAVSTIDVSGDDNYPVIKPATPVDGKNGFEEYIGENIRFPGESGLDRAVVVLGFVCGLDGRPRDITVLRSAGDPFSREAIRLLNGGPAWNPATKDGIPFEQPTRVRIVFKRGS